MTEPVAESARNRNARTGDGAALLALALLGLPPALFAILGLRSGLWAVAGALVACGLAWPLRGRLPGMAGVLVFPLAGYLGAMIGELLRPTRLRFTVPAPGEWLYWIAGITHPEALMLGGLYVGIGVAAVSFLLRSRAPTVPELPPPGRPGAARWFFVVGALAAGVAGHGPGFSLSVLESKNIFDRAVRQATFELPRLEAEHRARTGRFALTLEDLGVADMDPYSALDVEMSENAAGAFEAEIRHADWWGLACHVRVPPVSDTTGIEELTVETCVEQPARRPISVLRCEPPACEANRRIGDSNALSVQKPRQVLERLRR